MIYIYYDIYYVHIYRYILGTCIYIQYMQNVCMYINKNHTAGHGSFAFFNHLPFHPRMFPTPTTCTRWEAADSSQLPRSTPGGSWAEGSFIQSSLASSITASTCRTSVQIKSLTLASSLASRADFNLFTKSELTG